MLGVRLVHSGVDCVSHARQIALYDFARKEHLADGVAFVCQPVDALAVAIESGKRPENLGVDAVLHERVCHVAVLSGGCVEVDCLALVVCDDVRHFEEANQTPENNARGWPFNSCVGSTLGALTLFGPSVSQLVVSRTESGRGNPHEVPGRRVHSPYASAGFDFFDEDRIERDSFSYGLLACESDARGRLVEFG